MPAFSDSSKSKLATAHPDLQRVFNEVIKTWDCTILEGHRGEAEQNACCEKGLSKVKWPNSPHNATPSNAVDAVPYPIDWNNKARMTLFAGFVLGTAAYMGIKLRWGGDWNGNGNPSDESFIDMPHFEKV